MDFTMFKIFEIFQRSSLLIKKLKNLGTTRGLVMVSLENFDLIQWFVYLF